MTDLPSTPSPYRGPYSPWTIYTGLPKSYPSITSSCIIFPIDAHTFVIKSGMKSDGPYLHANELEEMVGTMVDEPQ